jgi:flagellar basal-body rod modification protein FlgD
MISDVSAGGPPFADRSDVGEGGPPSRTSMAGGPGGAMGREEFLQLLVTQLQNQDPLNPLEAEEFAAQLAQFAQVEQLIELNEVGKRGLKKTEALAQAQNNATALDALGKDVLALGDGLLIPEEGPAVVSVSVGGAGGQGVVRVFDADGREVGSQDLGFVYGGRQELILEDAVEGLQPGRYRYSVEVSAEDGSPLEVRTFTRSRVDGVRYGPDGPMLLVAGDEIPLGSVLEIVAPLPKEE